MRAHALLLALITGLLCGACTTHPAPNTPQAFCDATAGQDPEVHQLQIQALGSDTNYGRTREAVAAARATAIKQCLQRQGIPAARGGVQSPDRSGTLY